MKKYKNLVFLVVAVLLSGAAGLAAIHYMEQQEARILAEQEARLDYHQVIVPKYDLPVGEVISYDTVSAMQIPAAYIPDGALMPEEFDQIAGMVIDSPATMGKPLLRMHIQGLQSVKKFSQLIEKGHRSVTLKVSSLDTAENLLTVGDYVDILLMHNEKNQALKLEPVLDRVMVLATGITTVSNMYESEYDDGYTSITVAVKTSDFSKVVAARENGNLVYALRNPEDQKRANYMPSSEKSVGAVAVFSGGKSQSGMLIQTNIDVSGHNTPKNAKSGRIIKMYKPSVGENHEKTVPDALSHVVR